MVQKKDGNSDEPDTFKDDIKDKTYTGTDLQSDGDYVENTHSSRENTDAEKLKNSEIEDADVREQLPGTESNTEGATLLDKDEKLETGEEPEQDETDSSNLDGLPIDRGWAWFVLAACFLNAILMVGYGRAIGILFVEYLKVFEASATKTALFIGVIAGVYSISSLFSMNILHQIMGTRKMVLLGGLITTLGMLSAVFATSITFLICTHSVLIGIGHSMIHNPGLVLVGQYFKKRRGLAISVSMSGISVGGSIFPPFIRYLLDEYGLRGSMLILTGVTMNMFVGGLLYRPLSFYTRRQSNLRKQESTFVESLLNVQDNSTSESVVDCDSQDCKTTDNDVWSGHRQKLDTLPEHSENSLDGSRTELNMFYSNHELTSMLDITQKNTKSTEAFETNNSKTIFGHFKRAVALFDFKLFRNPMFQLIVVTSHFAIVYVLVGIYLPALATEKGTSPTETSLLLTISYILDFISRLAFGFLADLKWIKVHHIMAIGLILAGTVTHFTIFYNSYALLVLFSVLFGLFGSSYYCLTPVYIVEFVGLANMANTIGFVAVFHGLAVSLTHPILGAIRDLTGSYDFCFNYIGVCNYIAAICLFCEPLARRRLTKLKDNK